MSNRIVFTNLFTVKGTDVSANPYVEMMGIWQLFLKSFGGLGPEDKIMLVMDEVTHAFLRGTGEVDDFLRSVSIGLYPQPATTLEGMKARYSFAAHLQESNPGATYLYLDLDVLVCRPLETLYDPIMARNRLIYVTEEVVRPLVGGLLGDNYLAGRIEDLTDAQKADLEPQGGISSGIFGWHNSKPTFSSFFRGIVEAMDVSGGKVYFTLDQPYFVEAVVRQRLKSAWSTYHIDSEKIGINEYVKPESPYVLMNYCGEPGMGQNHLTKMLAAFAAVFHGIPMKESIGLNDFDAPDISCVNDVVDPTSQANAVVDPNPPSPLSVALETAPKTT
jgi:hypothetical protein